MHSALGYRSPEEFEQQSERGNSADSLGATVQFIVNDGNGENEERASTFCAHFAPKSFLSGAFRQVGLNC